MTFHSTRFPWRSGPAFLSGRRGWREGHKSPATAGAGDCDGDAGPGLCPRHGVEDHLLLVDGPQDAQLDSRTKSLELECGIRCFSYYFDQNLYYTHGRSEGGRVRVSVISILDSVPVTVLCLAASLRRPRSHDSKRNVHGNRKSVCIIYIYVFAINNEMLVFFQEMLSVIPTEKS